MSAAKADGPDWVPSVSSGAVGGRTDEVHPEPLTVEAALFEQLIGSAPHALAFVEGPSHVLRRASPAFCQLHGIEPGEVLGRPYAKVFAEPTGEGLLPLLDRVRASGAAEADQEIVRRRAGGESAVWSCTVWALGSGSNGARGLVIELRNRTHEAGQVENLREMADQIRQINERLLRSALQEHEWAEKAQAAAKAKSDFLSMMSHELRTPLNGIVSYADVLLGQITGPVNDRQREALQRINACAAQLIELIEDVLAFAQAEEKSLQMRLRCVDLCDVVREVVAVIEPMAARKHLRFRAELPEGSLPLETDPRWVRQILLNLVGNAVKFTMEGEVLIDVREEVEEIAFWVTDTGIGISTDELERVFEPFVQSEAVMTRRFGGTGLGLPISRSLAALLGGTLTAESVPGQGSTFGLHLPRAAAAAGPAP
jgi:signal transduction histidine kinase